MRLVQMRIITSEDGGLAENLLGNEGIISSEKVSATYSNRGVLYQEMNSHQTNMSII